MQQDHSSIQFRGRVYHYDPETDCFRSHDVPETGRWSWLIAVAVLALVAAVITG